MQVRYVFSELRQGLRRNVSMHIAVVLTLFVSMTLLGLGVLMKQQSDIATQYLGNQLQVTVYLCRDGDKNAACTGEVTEEQKLRVEQTIEDNPETASYRYESQEEAFEKVKEAVRRGPVRRTEPGDDLGGHATVLLDDAEGSAEVRGRHQRGGRPRRRLPDP